MNRLICALFFALFFAGSLCAALSAEYVPSWWWDSSNPVLLTGVPANNLGVANAGQLKWMALRAKAHFDATLPGGAGTAINNLVAGFALTGNFKPVNLGQLKIVALPFYDKLWSLSPRYDTNLNLKANGYLPIWTGQYPWNPATPVSENYKPATIGQLKLVFSFDIVDTNHNGTMDYAEGIYPAANATADDVDADGIPNSVDAFPNDPTRSSPLVSNPSDHTGPTISLLKPTGAVLLP